MKNVCIIGFGVSGMASARHCISKGYTIKILEKESNIGGVWLTKTYPHVRLQTTKHSYAFSDFPHLQSTSLYPTCEELMIYFEAYCVKHDIKKYCEFNSIVYNTKFDLIKNKWIIYYKNNKTGFTNEISVDYLIISTGIYSKKKQSLTVSRSNKKIVYPEHLNNNNINTLMDKNIVIIGNGPTGCDIAELCHIYKSKTITLLYRSNRWIFQRYLWNKISTHNCLSRFNMKVAQFLPKHIYILVLIILYYIIYIFGQGRLSIDIKPPYSVINRNNLVLNETILDLIYKKQIHYIKTNTINIMDNYIRYDNTSINYDYCFICTGYKTDLNFLGYSDLPYLYNKIIHPNLKQCAFIGFAESFNWIQVSELQIKWYLNYINNDMDLHQLNNLVRMEQNNTSRHYAYNDLSINVYNYCDKLSAEINIKPKLTMYTLDYWFSSTKYDCWE